MKEEETEDVKTKLELVNAKITEVTSQAQDTYQSSLLTMLTPTIPEIIFSSQ